VASPEGGNQGGNAPLGVAMGGTGRMERLADGMGSRLVLVCTPAGFGKTTLLADWARSGRQPVAWLSLDDGDNDPARFWRHATAALDEVRPGIADRVRPLLGPPSPGSFDGLVTALINELAGAAERAVLVVDDYHLIQAPPVHQSVEFLLEHLPDPLRLVVASRADPPLPLARWRARGQLTELREADLRFTQEEAAALLHAAVGAELPATAVSALEDRTEGWAAGLHLAAISLQGHRDPTGFVRGFSGSHRYVLDYLAEEVLDHQAEQLRSFLLESSVLERLSGGLCDATTGRTDSQQLLEEIERINLFLVPLDEERVTELHRAAAAWYEQHQLADEAVGHARAAGDSAWVARLIERNYEELLARSEDATVRGWLLALPAEAAGSRPRLLLAQAFWALIGGRLEAVEGWWMRPSGRSRRSPTSRTSRRSAGVPAWSPTCRRRWHGCGPLSPPSAARPTRRSPSGARPWPRWTRPSGCRNP
jgi:LuxR family transcriptional regulator, maltose regulon positive regulatory protein